MIKRNVINKAFQSKMVENLSGDVIFDGDKKVVYMNADNGIVISSPYSVPDKDLVFDSGVTVFRMKDIFHEMTSDEVKELKLTSVSTYIAVIDGELKFFKSFDKKDYAEHITTLTPIETSHTYGNVLKDEVSLMKKEIQDTDFQDMKVVLLDYLKNAAIKIKYQIFNPYIVIDDGIVKCCSSNGFTIQNLDIDATEVIDGRHSFKLDVDSMTMVMDFGRNFNTQELKMVKNDDYLSFDYESRQDQVKISLPKGLAFEEFYEEAVVIDTSGIESDTVEMLSIDEYNIAELQSDFAKKFFARPASARREFRGPVIEGGFFKQLVFTETKDDEGDVNRHRQTHASYESSLDMEESGKYYIPMFWLDKFLEQEYDRCILYVANSKGKTYITNGYNKLAIGMRQNNFNAK